MGLVDAVYDAAAQIFAAITALLASIGITWIRSVDRKAGRAEELARKNRERISGREGDELDQGIEGKVIDIDEKLDALGGTVDRMDRKLDEVIYNQNT